MRSLVSATILVWIALSFSTLTAQTFTIRGTVMSAENPPQPLAGATVVASGTERGATTDSLGRFQIGGLSNGSYTLRIEAAGFTKLTVDATIKGADQRLYVAVPRASAPVSPPPGLVFSGSVASQRSNGTATPLAGALLTLQPGGITARSNAGGDFRFSGLRDGAYTLTVRADDHTDVVSIFQLSANRSMQITMMAK